jgi:hypothetical protein
MATRRTYGNAQYDYFTERLPHMNLTRFGTNCGRLAAMQPLCVTSGSIIGTQPKEVVYCPVEMGDSAFMIYSLSKVFIKSLLLWDIFGKIRVTQET